MTKFEKQLHDMFDHIWECEIDHPVFQDTVGDLMSAVIQAYNNSAQPDNRLAKIADLVEGTIDHFDLDDAIEAIEEITWYHQNINNDMVSGANSSEHQAWYKADDVYKALESVPSAQPEPCEFCKHNDTSDDVACLRCTAERRTDD